jgi:hypothetical protein
LAFEKPNLDALLDDPVETPDTPEAPLPLRKVENLGAELHKAQPVINSFLGSIGAAGDPIIATKARELAAKAIQTYNPDAGAGLPTWINRQLMPLIRYQRRTSTIGIPERTLLDSQAIWRFTQNYMDKHNKEPDVLTISDKLGLSPKRIEEVTRVGKIKPVGDDVSDGGVRLTDSDYEAANILLPDLDPYQRKVFEHRTGFGGKPILGVVELGKLTGRSAASISATAASLAARLTAIRQDFDAVNGGGG